MDSDGQFYESKELQPILDRIFFLIRHNDPHAADSLIEEFNLHFLCEAL